MNKKINIDLLTLKTLLSDYKPFLTPLFTIFSCLLVFLVFILPQANEFLSSQKTVNEEKTKLNNLRGNLQTLQNLSDGELGNQYELLSYALPPEKNFEAIINSLYNKEEQVFLKGIYYDNNGVVKEDKTLDISTAYGLFNYGILNIDDPRLIKTMDKTIARLWGNSGCKGMARYGGDDYYSLSKDAPENIWFISTMWLAEYYIARAKTVEDLKPAEELFYWVTDRALSSGALSEQLNPYNGEPLSVAPLTWSHAGFIIAVVKYIEKFEKLNNSI